ncbi:MAG: hypothetical protein R3D98_13675 [Candidatus Krumholzibacteriia bacterium]
MRRVRLGIASLLLSACGWAVTGLAADPAAAVTGTAVYSRDDWLYADLALRDVIDSRTRSTIDSGLSGVCAYEVTLLDSGSQVVVRRRWALHLEHDLWDDQYLVRGPEGEHLLASLAAMDSLCSSIDGLRLTPLGRLDLDGVYRLQVTVEVQPLAAEDQDRLARYVSRRGDRNREELDLDLGSLFGRLFTGGRGGTTAVDFTGPDFRPRALEHRP